MAVFVAHSVLFVFTMHDDVVAERDSATHLASVVEGSPIKSMILLLPLVN